MLFVICHKTSRGGYDNNVKVSLDSNMCFAYNNSLGLWASLCRTVFVQSFKVKCYLSFYETEFYNKMQVVVPLCNPQKKIVFMVGCAGWGVLQPELAFNLVVLRWILLYCLSDGSRMTGLLLVWALGSTVLHLTGITETMFWVVLITNHRSILSWAMHKPRCS